MLAMTTSPSEKNLAHVSLVRQQRELEKEKRAAEKLRSMPDHHDKPTPLFNPPVKKEYNDETAARLKNLLGEPATVAIPPSRHSGRSQQDRRSLPLQQPLPLHRDADLPPKRAESPVVTATTRLCDAASVLLGASARPTAGHSISLADGKGIPSSALPTLVAGSSSPTRGQCSNPPLAMQGSTFTSSGESMRPLSPWHEPMSSGFAFDSGAAIKVMGHTSVAASNSNNCSIAVQDSSSPAHGSVFQKPLPRATANGLLNGMKPNIPKLVISDELVDHDVSSILQEMRSLTPLSGINTPRKEMPVLRFPVPGDTKGIVQAETTLDSNRLSARTSDNDVLAELITSDTDESDKSDVEESQSSSGHSTSDSDDDTSQSRDSDSDDDRSGRCSAEPVVVARDRSSRPPEVLTSISNASHGAHSGDSWSLAALDPHSCGQVETPPLEPQGLASSSNRGKQLPGDRPVSWSMGIEEFLSTSHESNDTSVNAPAASHVATANEPSRCADIIADDNEALQCHDDVSEHGSVNHANDQNVFSDIHSSPKVALSPDGGDDTDDEDITVDIESVSPSCHEKVVLRHDTSRNKTRSFSSAAGDLLGSNVGDAEDVADLTPVQSQPNLNTDERGHQSCEEVADARTLVKREVTICTSTVSTASEVEQSISGSPASMHMPRLASRNSQPLAVASPARTWPLLVSKFDQAFAVISSESIKASPVRLPKSDPPVVASPPETKRAPRLASKNDQPLTVKSPEPLKTSSLLTTRNEEPHGSPDDSWTSRLVSKGDQPLSVDSPETKRTAKPTAKNDQLLTAASPDSARTSSQLASKTDLFGSAGTPETKQTHLTPRNDQPVTAGSPERMLASGLPVFKNEQSTAGSPETKRTPRLATRDQPSVMPNAERPDEIMCPLSLVLHIPLHLINRLPTQNVPCKNMHSPSPAPSQSKNRSRYSSTSSSTSSDKFTSNVTEHDEVAQPTVAAAAATLKDNHERPKNGGVADKSNTDKADLSGRSSKRKSGSDHDAGISRKKSKSSKIDDAGVEAKSSSSTSESKKGPAKAWTVVTIKRNRSCDAGSASKKRHTGEQPPAAGMETDKAAGSVKSSSNSSSSSSHGDAPVRPPGPPLAPPSIPTKSAGPSYANGLPSRASSLLSGDLESLPEYTRSPEFYLPEAKRLKHKADLCGDMLQKYITYLESIHMFLLCARAIERDSPTNIAQIYKMYLETYRLLSHIHKHKHSKVVDTDVWAILSLWTQSLLCQKLYKLSRPDNEKHHKVVEQFFKEPISTNMGIAHSSASTQGHVKNHGSPASPAPSPSGSVASTSSLTSDSGNGTSGKTGVVCTPPGQLTSGAVNATNSHVPSGAPALPGAVSMPIKMYTSMKSYTQGVRLLELCHQWWDQADMLVLEERHRAFFTHVEEHVPPLTLHSSIIHLAHYIKMAVKSLRKMPDPSSSAGRYS